MLNHDTGRIPPSGTPAPTPAGGWSSRTRCSPQPHRDRAELAEQRRRPAAADRPCPGTHQVVHDHRAQHYHEQQQPERADLRFRRPWARAWRSPAARMTPCATISSSAMARGAWSRTTTRTPRRLRLGRTARAVSRVPAKIVHIPRPRQPGVPQLLPARRVLRQPHQRRPGDRGCCRPPRRRGTASTATSPPGRLTSEPKNIESASVDGPPCGNRAPATSPCWWNS